MRVNGAKYFQDKTSYSFNMPDYDVKLYAASSSCFVAGTRIMMADGNYENIENLQPGDLVMTWNFYKGAPEAQPITLYWYHGTNTTTVLNLNFSNETTIGIVMSHGFYDLDTDKFVFIDEDNYIDYIGHEFAIVGSGEPQIARLESVTVSVEETGIYSFETAYNGNAIAEGFLTFTTQDLPGLFEFFEVGEGLRYDEEKMNADIEKYGIYEYADWADYLSAVEFELFNGKYFKILVGKGIITEQDIVDLICDWLS